MIKVLPTIKGYTVDVRLREFRKIEEGADFEFIRFDSEEGDALLYEFISTIDENTEDGFKLLVSLF